MQSYPHSPPTGKPPIRGRAAGAQSDFLALYPTMCELAGIPAPTGLDAKSLVPVITGKQPKVRDTLFTAYKDVQRSIRDDRWRLILYPKVGVTQLFDLQKDPHEMTNLAGNPEYADRIKELTALMEKSQARYGDTAPLAVADPKPAAWDPSMATKSKPDRNKGNEKTRKSKKKQ